MPRFAANLSLLFNELPYLERFDAAAAAGFAGVEVLFPYDLAAKETHMALLRNGQDFVLMNAPPPNYAGGTPGYAALAGHESRFESDMCRVARYAEALRPERIHVMSGDAEGSEAADAFVRNLQWAADLLPSQNFTVEPLNPVSFPGYFMNDYDLAAELLIRIDRPNVGLQYDSFHAQMINGDAKGTWERFRPLVVHAQIGQSPARSEPTDGEIDFAALFAAIDESGYDGWVSAEYNPAGTTQEGLSWMR